MLHEAALPPESDTRDPRDRKERRDSEKKEKKERKERKEKKDREKKENEHRKEAGNPQTVTTPVEQDATESRHRVERREPKNAKEREEAPRIHTHDCSPRPPSPKPQRTNRDGPIPLSPRPRAADLDRVFRPSLRPRGTDQEQQDSKEDEKHRSQRRERKHGQEPEELSRHKLVQNLEAARHPLRHAHLDRPPALPQRGERKEDREIGEPKERRNPKDSKEPREHREPKDPIELKDPEEPKKPGESKLPKGPKEHKESKGHKGHKEAKEPKVLQNSDEDRELKERKEQKDRKKGQEGTRGQEGKGQSARGYREPALAAHMPAQPLPYLATNHATLASHKEDALRGEEHLRKEPVDHKVPAQRPKRHGEKTEGKQAQTLGQVAGTSDQFGQATSRPDRTVPAKAPVPVHVEAGPVVPAGDEERRNRLGRKASRASVLRKKDATKSRSKKRDPSRGEEKQSGSESARRSEGTIEHAQGKEGRGAANEGVSPCDSRPAGGHARSSDCGGPACRLGSVDGAVGCGGGGGLARLPLQDAGACVGGPGHGPGSGDSNASSLAMDKSVGAALSTDALLAAPFGAGPPAELTMGALQSTATMGPRDETEKVKAAFKRYDIDNSGFLDAVELRMALRELGYDTPLEVVQRLAFLGETYGLSFEQFHDVITSGKAGVQSLWTSSDRVDLAAKNPQQLATRLIPESVQTRHRRQEKRHALRSDCEDKEFLTASATKTPALGDGGDRWDDLASHRRTELKEVWAFWDRSKCGFLDARQLQQAAMALGFHFDAATAVRYCARHGGGISREHFYEIMSAQIWYRDEMLEMGHRTFLLTEEEEAKDLRQCTGVQRKRAFAKAGFHLRKSSATGKDFRWHPLCRTWHKQVAQHAVGMGLYFDILCVLCLALVVLAGTTTPFFLACYQGTALGKSKAQVDAVLGFLAQVSTANLDPQPEANTQRFAVLDSAGTLVFVVLLALLRCCRIPYATQGRVRIQDLAIQVANLPPDLGRLHVQYEELLWDHFTEVVAEHTAIDGSDTPDMPVREVVLWRDYHGAIRDILEQVELLEKERALDKELEQIEAKLQQEHDLGPLRRSRSTCRQTRISNHANTPEAVKLRHQYLKLVSRQEVLQERLLQIETARSMHSDMKAEERNVQGAFVVFWSQRARDIVVTQYRRSRCCCCSWLCQRLSLRFRPTAIGDDDSGSESSYYKEETVLKPRALLVEPAQDPSLQLWENIDMHLSDKRARRWKSRLGNFCTVVVAGSVAYLMRMGRTPSSIAIPIQAPVWIVTNITPPNGISSNSSGACWRVCEIELFSDDRCLTRLSVAGWSSSNGLQEAEEVGLRAVHDLNRVVGSVCHHDWRPAQCWEPIGLEVLGRSCLAAGACLGRRLGNADPLILSPASSAAPTAAPAATSTQPGAMRVAGGSVPEWRQQDPRRTSSCTWEQGVTSVVDIHFTFQTLLAPRRVWTAVETALGHAITAKLNGMLATLQGGWRYRPRIFAAAPPINASESANLWPMGVASAPCVDAAEAPVRLQQLLGLSGPDVEGLLSCRAFAQAGLLGYPLCTGLPRAYRCLCPETCDCSCSQTRGRSCDCSEGPATQTILPHGEAGTVITWDADAAVCLDSADQLEALRCSGANGAKLPLPVAQRTFLEVRFIYPIEATLGWPGQRSCTSASPCATGTVSCTNRHGRHVCAAQCNGVEECVDGFDELDCRTCRLATGAEAETTCSEPPGRCVDLDTAAQPCLECTTIVPNTMRAPSRGPMLANDGDCELMTVTSSTSRTSQCTISGLCPLLLQDVACDPLSTSYDPCKCLRSRRSAIARQGFSCLVRGDLSAAIRATPGLLAHHRFDQVKAAMVPDEQGHFDVRCRGPKGDTTACTTGAAEISVAGGFLAFSGSEWMTSVKPLPALDSHTFELWVRAKCTGCSVALLPGGGALLISTSGHLAARAPRGETWAPGTGPGLADGHWHFVAHALGGRWGERLFVDGAWVAQRNIAEARALGWQRQETNFTYGAVPGTGQLPPFVGGLDEGSIFSGELDEGQLQWHMGASTWHGRGPTFAERFLKAACQDMRQAAAARACSSASVASLLSSPSCLQGDACGCLRGLGLAARTALSECAFPCGSNSKGLRRTPLGVLEQKCGDEDYKIRSCQTDAECSILHGIPTTAQARGKWTCDLASRTCKLRQKFIDIRQCVRAHVCVAHSEAAGPLNEWAARQFLAGLSAQNGSALTGFRATKNCGATEGMSPPLHITVLNGAAVSAPARPRVPSVPQDSDDNTTGMEVDENSMVIGAGGFQTFMFDCTAPAGVPAWEQLQAIMTRFRDLSGLWVSEAPNATESSHLPMYEVPLVTGIPAPTPGTGIAAYAVVGVPYAEVLQHNVEKCDTAEFECSPGVCVPCIGLKCLCDGWVLCPAGEDEDFRRLARHAVRCAELEAMLQNVSRASDPCKGEHGLLCNGTCIPESQRCDGRQDCASGADEEGCPVPDVGRALGPELVAPSWVAAVFNTPAEVRCARVSQPAESPTELRLFACERSSVLHRAVPQPLFNPAGVCWPAAALTPELGPSGGNTSGGQTWFPSGPDHVDAQGTVLAPRCALGPDLRTDELLGLAAAILGWREHQAESRIAQCFCEQRLQLEPEVYINLPGSDDRAKICKSAKWRVRRNEQKAWGLVAVILVLNELFKYMIRLWVSLQRHKDYTMKLREHFWTLSVVLLLSTAILPAAMNWHLPMREWHLFVGSPLTAIAAIRVFWPHTLDLAAIPLRSCARCWKRDKCVNQEQLNALYTNPQFRLAEAYAEVVCTTSLAIIFGPRIPVLHWLAVVAIFMRYVFDWIVFLRGACRPPFYDDQTAKACIVYILVCLAFRTIVSGSTLVDQSLFPVFKDGCAAPLTEVAWWRKQQFQTLLDKFRGIQLARPCSSVWQMPAFALAFTSAVLLGMVVLPVMCEWVRQRDTQDEGKLYDDLAETCIAKGLISTYAPRVHPSYASAFQLIDLSAAYQDLDPSTSSSSSSSATDSEESTEGSDGTSSGGRGTPRSSPTSPLGSPPLEAHRSKLTPTLIGCPQDLCNGERPHEEVQPTREKRHRNMEERRKKHKAKAEDGTEVAPTKREKEDKEKEKEEKEKKEKKEKKGKREKKDKKEKKHGRREKCNPKEETLETGVGVEDQGEYMIGLKRLKKEQRKEAKEARLADKRAQLALRGDHITKMLRQRAR